MFWIQLSIVSGKRFDIIISLGNDSITKTFYPTNGAMILKTKLFKQVSTPKLTDKTISK